MKRVHKGLIVALVGGIAMLLAAGSAWAQSATPSSTATGGSGGPVTFIEGTINDMHVVIKHVMPNLMPVIFANTILTIAIAILSESQLSFLGLGDPKSQSWGTLIEEAFNHGALTLHAWWWLMAPSISIVLVVLGFTMVGFAMDEIVNPRIRER